MTHQAPSSRHADSNVSRYRAATWDGRPPCAWADLDDHERHIWRQFFQCHLEDIASGRHSDPTDTDCEVE